MRNSPRPDPLDQSTRLLKAFADPVRLRLVNLLSHEDREVCVCHLHEALNLPQPTVSRHLAYLRRSSVVIGRKEGLWVYYRLSKPQMELHRRLLECVGKSLVDFEMMREDRERLRRLSCC
jgi:ArsR family transcriptional regulator